MKISVEHQINYNFFKCNHIHVRIIFVYDNHFFQIYKEKTVLKFAGKSKS